MSPIARCLIPALGLLVCQAAFAQVQRTFVASHGHDANVAVNCTLASPCRSFTAAQNATISGGEIVALDAAGYGAITITKSISILANPGVYAGISVSSGGTAVTIATTGAVVRLSNLKINAVGGAGNFGISLTAPFATLTVDNCAVTGFGGHGIEVTGSDANVRVANSLVAGNQGFGIHVAAGTADIVGTRVFANVLGGIIADNFNGTTTSVAVTDSVASRNGEGFIARASNVDDSTAKLTVSDSSADNNFGAGYHAAALTGTGMIATVHVSASKASGNGVGLQQSGTGATLKSAGNNFVTGNTDETIGAITNVGTM